MTLPSDPLYANQWHFSLIGDIQSIWNDYDGSGVSVGIFDDGLAYTHGDLAANYDASLHFSYGGSVYDPLPVSANDGHGTAVAGLIGAVQGNSLGGVGVAYGASLTGVNFLSDIQYQSTQIVLAALGHGASFDVMNNSWGRTPDFSASENLTIPTSQASIFRDVFGTVVAGGRSGLGTVIVQAAGNDAANSNGEGLAASRFDITTAATQSDGFVASFSNYGSNVLLAAPSASVTTDLTGTAGYSNGDYTTSFGGTSAATPIVSGVTALMLQANPQLGWRDVQNILAISATQTGSGFGMAGSGFEQESWFSNGADNWNGGGMSYHLSYGYGMVNAYAAVHMAEVWSVFHQVAATSANEQTVSASYTGPAVDILDNSQAVAAITVTPSLRIENIEVTVNMQHSWAADVVMYLVAPDGSKFQLIRNEGGSTLMDTGFNWSFGVAGARDMDSAGIWTLQINDTGTSDTGVLNDWQIAFFGAQSSADDVYHFTDDYLGLAGVEAGRTMLTDSDGGVDWLNFASVSGAVSLDLSLGEYSVAGTPWGSLANGNMFENIALGSGADHVIGNGKDNRILGMGGDDILIGGAGNDTLNGGAGNDTLDGGWGGDVLDGGAGVDTVDYSGATNKQKINLVTNVNIGGFAHNDTLSGIENVIGANTRGDDITGSAGDNALYGNGADDILRGFNGDDTLFGGANNDYLYGGRGADALYGGAGNDWAMYNDSTVGVIVSLVTGGSAGYANGDTYFDIERVRGSIHDDVITGDAGSNKLLGDGGNDTINGAAGRDNLRGGSGNDRLNGGAGTDGLRGDAGDDVFVFMPGNELDNVLDFDRFGNDRVDLSFTGVADYSAMSLIMSQAGTSVRLDFGGPDIMLLRHTNVVDLTVDDFIF